MRGRVHRGLDDAQGDGIDPATRPAPMPREAPVMMATLWVVMATRYSTGGGFAMSGRRYHCPFWKKDL
jgi:hypothetical protein